MNIEVKNSIKPVDYLKSMKLLEERVEDVFLKKKSEFLWLLEHETVFTKGIRGKDNELLNKNINIIKTNRGGKYTLHSPGQKVIYFVLNLKNRKKDIRKLIMDIERCIIEVLKEFNIKSQADPKNIGIWVKEKNKLKKIAAIGVRVKKWVAYHGFSININNDLSLYNSIIPCGIKNKGITSMRKLGVSNYSNVENIIINKFLDTFLT